MLADESSKPVRQADIFSNNSVGSGGMVRIESAVNPWENVEVVDATGGEWTMWGAHLRLQIRH